MSWTQGVTPREDLPARFLEWADAQGKGPLQYITWFEPSRTEVFLDYGEAPSLKAVLK
jgi:hypothetical protein